MVFNFKPVGLKHFDLQHIVIDICVIIIVLFMRGTKNTKCPVFIHLVDLGYRSMFLLVYSVEGLQFGHRLLVSKNKIMFSYAVFLLRGYCWLLTGMSTSITVCT